MAISFFLFIDGFFSQRNARRNSNGAVENNRNSTRGLPVDTLSFLLCRVTRGQDGCESSTTTSTTSEKQKRGKMAELDVPDSCFSFSVSCSVSWPLSLVSESRGPPASFVAHRELVRRPSPVPTADTERKITDSGYTPAFS